MSGAEGRQERQRATYLNKSAEFQLHPRKSQGERAKPWEQMLSS
jgi:hypothetical protein